VIVGLRKDQEDWIWPQPTHSRAALVRELRAERYWDAHEVPERVRRRVRRRLANASRCHAPDWSTSAQCAVDPRSAPHLRWWRPPLR
jgi:hypothetical protein